MLTESQRITLDITKAQAELAKADKDIEACERCGKIKQYREQKRIWLARLEGQLARANAPYGKPTGHCVVETAPNGVKWDI